MDLQSKGGMVACVWLAAAVVSSTCAETADAPIGGEITRLTGDDLSAWRGDKGTWTVVGDVVLDPADSRALSTTAGRGVMVNGPTGRTHNLVSRGEFGDVQLHIEFMIPQGSNSGVYLMGRYEIQIFDSHEFVKAPYPGIECGGIYERWDETRTPKGFEGHSPRVNASRAPGQWQTFDVVFRAPRFDRQGQKIAAARFEKVSHNGVVIHQDLELGGPTRGALFADEQSVGPLMLQGDHGPIAYRNLRISPAGPLPFFAMDSGMRDRHRTPREQVAMVDELGYQGMGCTAGEDLAAVVKELDERRQVMFTVYAGATIDEGQPAYGPELEAALQALTGRNSILWLYVTSKQRDTSAPEGDPQAVQLIREIADMAKQHKVRVALYPHHGFWVERVEDAVRVARKVNRPNVGVTFNLCHWLRTGADQHVEQVLQLAMPYLFVVTINGADRDGSDWRQLIQTLDRGSFDTHAFLQTLLKLGYSGPIGLQGYGIGGDAHENLQRSMKAWRSLWMRLESES